ncbi:MAG: YraN family protein [Candidatus Limnocylindrales bacterium]
MCPAPSPMTARGRSGIAAEGVARRYLEGAGWTILGTNIVVGRGELDLVALDPGDPGALVIVEVRGTRTGRFGAPEESIGARKLASLRVAAMDLVRSAWLRERGLVAPMVLRLDVVAVDLDPKLVRLIGRPRVRHVRGV